MAGAQEYAFEVSGPTLKESNVGAKEVKSGKMYMVTVGQHFRFPIHPEPNADHKIAKLVRQYEVIVTTENPMQVVIMSKQYYPYLDGLENHVLMIKH